MKLLAVRAAHTLALASIALAAVACGDDGATSAGSGGAAGAGTGTGADAGTGTGTGTATGTGTGAGTGADTGAGAGPTSSGTPTSSSTDGAGGGTGGSGGGGSGGGGAICGDGAVGPTDVDHTLAWDGDDRTFRVHLPPGYPEAAPYPVVLLFHGYLEDGDQFETITQMTPDADERGVVVVYVDGRSQSFNAGSCCGSSSALGVDDVGFVASMIDAIVPQYCLDERRVYAAGFSNGGMLSYRLACELGDRIAAIGPTAGTLAIESCDPVRPVPVMHTHGTDDFVVPPGGGGFANARTLDDTISTWVALNGCTDEEPEEVYQQGDATCVAWTACAEDTEVRLCTIDGGGHQWPGGESAGPGGHLSQDLDTSAELLDFFLGHALPEGGNACGDPDDADCDGIEQALEDAIAADAFPYLSVDPTDACPLSGVVYRVRPHPVDPTKLFITYVVLYERDCGLNGHVGDDEVFGVTVDPTRSGAASIVAIKAIAHQGTPCEQVTECGTCEGSTPCVLLERDGEMVPTVFHSKNKHGGYAIDDCSFLCDMEGCTEAPTPATPPMVNVGEPDARLVDDLTTQGFITEANGWTETELFDFDPWALANDFGGAGEVSDDLQDDAFVPGCL